MKICFVARFCQLLYNRRIGVAVCYPCSRCTVFQTAGRLNSQGFVFPIVHSHKRQQRFSFLCPKFPASPLPISPPRAHCKDGKNLPDIRA